MTSIRLLLAASLSLSAASCTFHKADLWYPTVAEADAMDVQWGLSQRKPRGGPKQFYQYKSTDAAAMNLPPEEPAARTPAPAAPAPAPAAPAPAPQGNVNLIR
ncbi:MAG: hypothetical protein HS117_26890 [Verrucomicrobiaceae bacterium]|nr:hypothetical protein [Verrucomicrobiaceae bacterium]